MAIVKITITTFGTKLKVISFIDVAACIIPIISPITNATTSTGPANFKTFQKAQLNNSIIF